VFALVPADPLPPPAAGALTCVAAAGDALAYLRRARGICACASSRPTAPATSASARAWSR
jgi:hypothetical protein